MGVSSKGEKITFESWMKITGIFVSLLVFALLYTMNTPVQMTMQGKASLGMLWHGICTLGNTSHTNYSIRISSHLYACIYWRILTKECSVCIWTGCYLANVSRIHYNLWYGKIRVCQKNGIIHCFKIWHNCKTRLNFSGCC